jgi:hypothetical protein
MSRVENLWIYSWLFSLNFVKRKMYEFISEFWMIFNENFHDKNKQSVLWIFLSIIFSLKTDINMWRHSWRHKDT